MTNSIDIKIKAALISALVTLSIIATHVTAFADVADPAWS